MTDLAPDFDFTAASQAAEQAAREGDEAEVKTTAPIEDTPGQPRDEKPEQPETPAEPEAEVEDEAAPEQADEPEDPALVEFLAKYGGDTDKALKAAAHLTNKIGEQGKELGELREFRERFEQYVAAQEEAQQPQVQHQPITADMIDENPELAVELAYQQGNGQALQLAFNKWYEYDPGVARAWRAEKLAEAQAQQQAQAMEERFKQFEQQLNPVLTGTKQQQFEREIQQVAARHPGIESFNEDQIAEVANQIPALATQLATGTPAEQAQAFETMWLIHQARHPADTPQPDPEPSPEDEKRAADAAYTASSTTTQPAEQKTPAELEAERMTGLFKTPASVWEDAKSWGTRT